jgi:hypothetical protein
MGELRRLLLRLRNAMAPGRAEAELSREVSSHLQLLEDDYQRQGLSPEDARRAARRSFGGVEQARNQHRDARSLVWLDDLRRDTAYAVRTLLRSPGFTTPVVVTLALAQRQVGGDPNIVGRRVDLNGRPAVVAGVMPQNIWHAESGWGVPEVWIPLVESPRRASASATRASATAAEKPVMQARAP